METVKNEKIKTFLSLYNETLDKSSIAKLNTSTGIHLSYVAKTKPVQAIDKAPLSPSHFTKMKNSCISRVVQETYLSLENECPSLSTITHNDSVSDLTSNETSFFLALPRKAPNSKSNLLGDTNNQDEEMFDLEFLQVPKKDCAQKVFLQASDCSFDWNNSSKQKDDGFKTSNGQNVVGRRSSNGLIDEDAEKRRIRNRRESDYTDKASKRPPRTFILDGSNQSNFNSTHSSRSTGTQSTEDSSDIELLLPKSRLARQSSINNFYSKRRATDNESPSIKNIDTTKGKNIARTSRLSRTSSVDDIKSAVESRLSRKSSLRNIHSNGRIKTDNNLDAVGKQQSLDTNDGIKKDAIARSRLVGQLSLNIASASDRSKVGTNDSNVKDERSNNGACDRNDKDAVTKSRLPRQSSLRNSYSNSNRLVAATKDSTKERSQMEICLSNETSNERKPGFYADSRIRKDRSKKRESDPMLCPSPGFELELQEPTRCVSRSLVRATSFNLLADAVDGIDDADKKSRHASLKRTKSDQVLKLTTSDQGLCELPYRIETESFFSHFEMELPKSKSENGELRPAPVNTKSSMVVVDVDIPKTKSEKTSRRSSAETKPTLSMIHRSSSIDNHKVSDDASCLCVVNAADQYKTDIQYDTDEEETNSGDEDNVFRISFAKTTIGIPSMAGKNTETSTSTNNSTTSPTTATTTNNNRQNNRRKKSEIPRQNGRSSEKNPSCKIDVHNYNHKNVSTTDSEKKECEKSRHRKTEIVRTHKKSSMNNGRKDMAVDDGNNCNVAEKKMLSQEKQPMKSETFLFDAIFDPDTH